MVSAETRSVIDRAKQIYTNQLQSDLESQHMDRLAQLWRPVDDSDAWAGECACACSICGANRRRQYGGRGWRVWYFLWVRQYVCGLRRTRLFSGG